MSDKQNDVKSVINKLISDHLLYSCATNTYEKLIKNISNKEVVDIKIRQMIRKNISEGKTFVSYVYMRENYIEISDDNLNNKLVQLAFIDYILGNQIVEAIEFAKNYFDKSQDHENIYVLVGYKPEEKEKFQEIIKKLDRETIMEELNSFLFYRTRNRKTSLLQDAISYYETLKKSD